jgi:hypothetical protein
MAVDMKTYLVGFLHGLFFYLEGGDTFLRNVG